MHLRPMEGELTTVEEATDSKNGQEEGQEVEESTVHENPIKDDDREECNADSQSTNEKTTTDSKAEMLDKNENKMYPKSQSDIET